MVNSAKIVPAALPPDGVVANFQDRQDGYYTLLFSVVVVSIILTNVFFLIHAYVKLVVKSGRLLREDCKSMSRTCYQYHRLKTSHFRVLHSIMGM